VRKFIGLSAALIFSEFAFGGLAFAADMPVKAPPPPPPSAQMPDWSGIYIGGHIGYQWDKIASIFDAAPSLAVPSVHSDTGVGGLQIDAQKQWNNFVLGVEGGITVPFSRPISQTPAPALGAFTHGATMDDPIYWVGGRAGVAFNNLMPYFTGGYAQAKFKWLDMTSAGGFESLGTSHNSGPYFGGGIDWAITHNWILGIDYRHYDFGTKDAPATAGPTGDAKTNDPKVDMLLMRLSYKFDSFMGKSPPVLATKD
jgi:opacity protein-like surface antigen